jgi:hypothetical protein
MFALRIAHQCAITRHCRFGASLRLNLAAAGVTLQVRVHVDSSENQKGGFRWVTDYCVGFVFARRPGRGVRNQRHVVRAGAQAAFQGVWRTVEVTVPGPTVRTFKPGATLAIFHGRHYSRVEVHAEQPLTQLADPQALPRISCAPCGGPSSAKRGPSR